MPFPGIWFGSGRWIQVPTRGSLLMLRAPVIFCHSCGSTFHRLMYVLYLHGLRWRYVGFLHVLFFCFNARNVVCLLCPSWAGIRWTEIFRPLLRQFSAIYRHTLNFLKPSWIKPLGIVPACCATLRLSVQVHIYTDTRCWSYYWTCYCGIASSTYPHPWLLHHTLLHDVLKKPRSCLATFLSVVGPKMCLYLWFCPAFRDPSLYTTSSSEPGVFYQAAWKFSCGYFYVFCIVPPVAFKHSILLPNRYGFPSLCV